jgi:FKBP-type peptidyl-prolyl cis-trans isomerase
MAVTGMKVGARAAPSSRLTGPYGTTGSGPVPPNAALVFDIALNSVQ